MNKRLSAIYLDEVLEGTAGLREDVVLKHPFLLRPIVGRPAVLDALNACQATMPFEPVIAESFSSAALKAVVWRDAKNDSVPSGVTVAVMDSDGAVNELLLIGSLKPGMSEWRSKLRANIGTPAGNAWELSDDVDQTAYPPQEGEIIDPKFGMPAAEDIVFTSPALLRPVQGAAVVSHVVGHASIVYGSRSYGPQVRRRNRIFGLWKAMISGQPIESAHIIEVRNRAITELTLFMQPYPTVALVRDRVRVRLEAYLGPGFF